VTTTVHQVVPVLETGDAVGNEVRALRRRLQQHGFDSNVFAVDCGRGENGVQPIDELLAGPRPDAVLFHYAVSSPVTEKLAAAGLPLILLDHNTTPAHYFRLIDRAHYDACRTARREIGVLRGQVRLAVGRSDFTRRELDAMGFRDTAVLPVLSETGDGRASLPGRMRDSPSARGTVLLTVGRVAPNKRLDDAIRLLHAYRRGFDSHAELWIAGDHTRLPVYRRALDGLIEHLGEDGVRFLGHVSDADLDDCFENASVYVSMSEHEGFGVPLVDAMRRGVPVLARAAAAVPETVGEAGVLTRGRNFPAMAAAARQLVEDRGLRRRQIEKGHQQAARLGPEATTARLLDLLAGVGVTPR
jgi:glycosyltransferase involved in cell wall biosynthesis